MTQRILVPVLLLMGFPAFAMEILEETELQSITGQAGVALELGMDFNTNPDGSIALTDCDTLSGPCRLALSFANRTDEWLVLKGYYGNFSIPTLNLDAAYLSEAGSDPSLFDSSKFLDEAQNCLLPGGTCDTSALDNMAAMKIGLPTSIGHYDPGTQISSGYNNILFAMTLTGTAVEFGSGPTGYNANNNGSFLGIRVKDTNSAFAGVNVQGNAYIFGF